MKTKVNQPQRSVIVTGGGRGIGAATARLLASKGYSVCINYRSNTEAAETLVSEITETGGQVFAFQADVSKESDVIKLFDATESEFGRVTDLVNNAGILFAQSPLVDIDVERFNKIMTSNVTSCFLCSREFVRRSREQGGIVNVSSIASKTGAPLEYVDYATSKGAMDSLTKGLAMEVAGRGIRVNAVRPGFILTSMHADGGEPNRVERLIPKIPLQRGGTPEDVAHAILWLLSSDSSFVTGSLIDLAGGI